MWTSDARADRLTGILNGVDYSVWSPDRDSLIPMKYSSKNLAGKRVCKEALLDEYQLRKDNLNRPALGIVSRFADQKGFDLISQVAVGLLHEDIQLAVLGTGDRKYEEMFRALAADFPGRVGVKIGYDNKIAHLIEAGADIFVMPSRYEPCGLNQTRKRFWLELMKTVLASTAPTEVVFACILRAIRQFPA